MQKPLYSKSFTGSLPGLKEVVDVRLRSNSLGLRAIVPPQITTTAP